MTWPIQIDPTGCGCTECIIGQYIQMDRATVTQIYDMLEGRLGNGTPWERSQWLTVRDGEGKILRIIDPRKNDEFLDSISSQEWGIR